MSTSINIIPNDNVISVQDSNNQITITSNTSNVVVDVTQPITNTVQVLTGPQGQKGDQGPVGPSGSSANIDTGSLVTTSSFNSFTSSYTTDSSSFNSRIGSLTAATSSYVLNSQTSSMTVLSASFARTASFLPVGTYAITSSNAVSSSYSLTASYVQAAGNDTYVQYNSNGDFAANGGLTYNYGSLGLQQGDNVNAIGDYSHAEGSSTDAIGNYSHAEGSSTDAIGNYSHAEGAQNISGYKGFLSTMPSSGVIILDQSYEDVSSLFTAGNFIILSDTDEENNYGTIELEINFGDFDGTNTIIYLVNTTIATSVAVIGLPDDPQPSGADRNDGGSYSHAEGFSTKTIGWSSHAEGQSTTAKGDYSHAEGRSTKTIGNSSHAEGSDTQAIGDASHAEGRSTQAIGGRSHAEGFGAATIGDYSHAEGDNTQTGTAAAYGKGKGNLIINGTVKLNESYGDVTTEFQSGQDLYLYDPTNLGRKIFKIQSSIYSLIDGATSIQLTDNTVNTANGCVVCINFGIQNHRGDQTIPAPYSHTEGNDTRTLDEYSHAEGRGTQAIGSYSHAEGLGTIALGPSQHVQGQYNIPSSDQSAFIIGNGTSNNARSNLIFASGSNFQINGSLGVTNDLLVNGNTFAVNSANNRVGIGKTNPSTTLDVNGNTIITGSFTVVTGSAVELRVTNTGVTIGNAVTDVHSITGSARLTGSFQITGSVTGRPISLPTASGTASLNCSLGNFFTLTLSSSFTMLLSASNIQPGQTINLRITQPATSGSLTYSSAVFKFPGGIPYTASASGSAVDIISFISFDSSTLNGTAIKNLS
jgi:hypothetical protein